MSGQFAITEHMGIIRSFGFRVLKRLHAAGARGIDLEDVVGELTLAWVVASKNWNAECGVPFVPYLRRGMRNHINQWASGEVERAPRIAVSLDDELESGATLHDAISSEEEPADNLLVLQQRRERMLARMSPTARLVVELIESPPEPIIAELQAWQAKAIYARARGFNCVAPKHVTMRLVMDALGLGPHDRNVVNKELKNLVAINKGNQ